MQTTDTQKQIAEHTRLAAKELLWAAQHLASIYETIRSDDSPSFSDPNQLNLFTEPQQSCES